MNILILGSGGREHALAWAVMQNPKCDKLIVAPATPGLPRLPHAQRWISRTAARWRSLRKPRP